MHRLIGWIAAALLCPAALAMAGEVAPHEMLRADIERTYEAATPSMISLLASSLPSQPCTLTNLPGSRSL